MQTFLIINKDTYAKDDKAVCKWELFIFGIKVAIIKHTTTELSVINKLITKKNKSFKIKDFTNED